MEIKTKLDLNQNCWFMIQNKPECAMITEIEIRKTIHESVVTYTIDKNPAGTQFTTRYLESNVFPTKQELIDSL